MAQLGHVMGVGIQRGRLRCRVDQVSCGLVVAWLDVVPGVGVRCSRLVVRSRLVVNANPARGNVQGDVVEEEWLPVVVGVDIRCSRHFQWRSVFECAVRQSSVVVQCLLESLRLGRR